MKRKTIFGKRIFAILLIGLLTAAGCGSQTNQTTEAKEESVAAATVSTEQSTAVTQAPAENSSVSSKAEEPKEIEETAPPKTSKRDLAGIYHFTGMTLNGEVTPTKEIAVLEDMGMEMLLILNEDGTGTLNLGDENKITWDEKTITVLDESIPFVWDPETQRITFSQDGQELQFTVKTAKELVEAGLGIEGTPGLLSDLYDDSKAETAETIDFKMIGADWVPVSRTIEGIDKGLCVWYEFTNNTDKYMAPYYVTAYATQDGNELEEGMIYVSGDELAMEETYRYSAIRPGVTGRSVHLLNADPEGGKIKYKVSIGYLDDNIIFETELDPDKLPGKPKEKYKPKKIEKIDWLSEVPEKGTFNMDFEVAILDSEIIKSDYDGSNYLRVWFDFTNNFEEEKSFFMTCYYRAVQDGITLNTGWSTIDDPDLDKYVEMVPPGKTTRVCIEWQLRDDSPVAVELYDWWTEETQLGKVFEVK